MNLLAIKMLMGDRAKYLGIVTGLTFAALLIVQQMGIFCGFLDMTYTATRRMPQANIWVADPDIRFIGDSRPMLDSALLRTRGVDGVKWAVPYYTGMIRVRLPDGRAESCILTGVDDATLVGAPTEMIEGSVEDLRASDAVIIDKRTAYEVFAVRLTKDPDGPTRPIAVGENIEINDQRARVVGICKTTLQIQGEATVYTTYNRAKRYAPFERKQLSYILASTNEGADVNEVCDRIESATRMMALTPDAFRDKTYNFFVYKGGFGVFFGITVLFGVIIGVGIAGQMFYSFVHDNLKYFATLKAMGTGSFRLVIMVVQQATVAGFLGWGVGVGLASLFGYAVKDSDQIVFIIPPALLLGSMVLMLAISWISAMLSIRTVIKLDPAVVFK